jgi:cysteine desulfuration protein SufE
MTVDEVQEEILKELPASGDWLDIYEYLIALGRDLAPLDEQFKIEENALKGCQARVWIRGELTHDKLRFSADSDSLITKGLVSMLLRILNDRDPCEIAGADLYIIERMGLNSNLSPSRANGLKSIIKHLRDFALGSIHVH